MTEPVAKLIADDQISVQVTTAQEAQALAKSLHQNRYWTEIVPGLESVTVQFNPLDISPDTALAEIAGSLKSPIPTLPTQTKSITITVHYGGEAGPDLPDLATQTGLPPSKIVARHTAATYRVEMLGFTPGFAYLSGLDPDLNVPRLTSPRALVPAGSVGISGSYCGLYALQGPGGWPLIGRTDHPLFQPGQNKPFPLEPGMTLRFQAASA